MANKNEKNLQFNIGLDTKDLLKSTNAAIQIFKRFTNIINDTLKNLGKISMPETMMSNAELLSQKRVYRTTKEKGRPIESRKAIIDEFGNVKGEETRTVSYAPFRERTGGAKRSIKLLQKEEKITRKILDEQTGLYKTIERIVVSRQKNTNAGKIWQRIADETKISGEASIKQEKERLKQQKLQEKLSKKDGRKKTVIEKLFDRVKSVATYRLIRSALKGIVSSATQGLNNIAAVDKQFSQTLGTLQSSFTSLKNSFGMLLKPIIETLQPIITTLSDGLARIINNINEAKAAMAGQSTYTKILTSDMEEYKKQIDAANGSLTKFDTFNTISKQYTGTKTADVIMDKKESQGIIDKLEKVKSILNVVAGVLATIVGIKLVGWLAAVDVALIKTGILLQPVLSAILPMAAIIGGIVLAVKSFIDTWNNKSVFQNITNIIITLAASIAALVTALQLLKGNWIGALAIAGLVAGGTAYIMNSLTSKPVNTYATGGTFSSGDFFVANENGSTEMIASTNNGGNVMNLEQWERVAYNSYLRALQTYNAAKDGSVNMNTIGRAIAGNSGFVNEINRRNATINLV